MCAAQRDGALVPGVLATVAAEPVESGRGLARGDVVGPAGPLWDQPPLTALYATLPIYFDEVFHVFRGSSPPTVLVLLVPITDDEAAFVAAHGWDAFEEHLEADPDLFDLNRRCSLKVT